MKLNAERLKSPQMRAMEAVQTLEEQGDEFNVEAELTKKIKQFEVEMQDQLDELKLDGDFFIGHLISNINSVIILECALGRSLFLSSLIDKVKDYLIIHQPSPDNISPSQMNEDLDPAADLVRIFPDQQKRKQMSDETFDACFQAVEDSKEFYEGWEWDYFLNIKSLLVLRPDKKSQFSGIRPSDSYLEELNQKITEASSKHGYALLRHLKVIKLLFPEQFSQLRGWEQLLKNIPPSKIDLNLLATIAILLDPSSHLDERGQVVIHQLPKKIPARRTPLPERQVG